RGGPGIGFRGAGRMATALARGWLTARLVPPDQILAADPLPEARAAYQQATGGLSVLGDNRQVVAGSDVLVLAVKPQNLAAMLSEIRATTAARHLVVSIVAGAPPRAPGPRRGHGQP